VEPNTEKSKRSDREPKHTTPNGAGQPDAGRTSDAEHAEGERKAKDAGGWENVQLDRPLYKPENCAETPLVGYVLDRIAMPENDNGPWSCFVIRLTAPCLAVDGFDADATPKTFPIGTEVLLNSTVKLKSVDRFLHPNWLIEIRVAPDKKVKLDGGRTMWTYKVAANKDSALKRPATLQITKHATPAAQAERERENDLPF
jgi:hypothetical protein